MRNRVMAGCASAVLLLVGCAAPGQDGQDGHDASDAPSLSVAEEDWVDVDGEDTDLVTSFSGDEHCGLESTEIIRVSADVVEPREPGWPETTFAHDPEGGLADRLVHGEYDGSTELPDEARHAGVRTVSGIELWVDPDESEVIYLRDDDHVEQWPAASVECD
ncbi:MAG: hypothetical protein ACQETV_02850 [Actinomycetota bacterium]